MDTPIEKTFKLFCCGIINCYREFSSTENLRRHFLIHHKRVRETHCSECGKYFKNKQNLKEHLFIHRDLKPYQCEGCEISFRHKTAFIRHKKYCIGSNLNN
jgi:uncharacterized Zn-finger protein